MSAPNLQALAHDSIVDGDPQALFRQVSRALLEKHHVSPENAALFPVDGNSMAPTIEHHDIVLVNTSDTRLRQSRVYVVLIDDKHMLVKRVQRIPQGINLLSDNPIYGPITVMDDDTDNAVTIIGRVAASLSVTEMLP